MKHTHSVYDTDSHFSISSITRAIKNESSKKTTVMQYDHNSERFTFEMPRYIEGHDMTLCNKAEVHYINIASDKSGRSSNIYVIDDMQVSPEDESIVICSWLISQNATMYAGTLNFLLRFVCLDDDFTVTYAWNTAIFKEITISNGIFNDTEEVVTPYLDVLESWKSEVDQTLVDKQDKLPENEGSTSHRVYVAAPQGFTDEDGNEVKYHLKRIAGYDGTGKGASNGDIGIVTKANRDKKVAEGLITTADGAYENYIEHDEPYPASIACRDRNGRLVVEDGVKDFHAVNKRQLKNSLSTRVESVDKSYAVYGKGKSGQDMTYPIDTSTAVAQGNIVRRQTDGCIYVPMTPTGNGQAASKKYVDDAVKNASGGGSAKLYLHKVCIYSNYSDEEWAENPSFYFEFAIYRTNNTPITSFTDISFVELINFKPSTFFLWDAPDAKRIPISVGKAYYSDDLVIEYIDFIGDISQGSDVGSCSIPFDKCSISDTVTEI